MGAYTCIINELCRKCGAPGGIRTPDLRLRRAIIDISPAFLSIPYVAQYGGDSGHYRATTFRVVLGDAVRCAYYVLNILLR